MGVNMSITEKYYFSKEAAEKLGISHDAFRCLVYRRKIKPTRKIGNYSLYAKELIEKLAEERKTKCAK